MTPSTFRLSDIHVLLMLPVEVPMAYDEVNIWQKRSVSAIATKTARRKIVLLGHKLKVTVK